MSNIKIKTIIATDIVNFTVKSSLLPLEKLNKLLQDHDKLIWILEKKWGKIAKNVGDGYLIFFDNINIAISAVHDLLNKIQEYNSKVSDELEKINIRVAITVGEVLEKKILTWTDYFWVAINLAYRILSITPGNSVYLSESVYTLANKWEFKIISLWAKKFKWIWEEVKVYKLSLNEKDEEYYEKVTKSSLLIKPEELDFIVKEVDQLIFKIASVAAVLVSQPIPLIDVSSVFFLQLYMTIEIAKKYRLNISEKLSYSLVSSFIWILGFEYGKSWGQIELMKFWLPGFWWYLQIGLAFSLVYSFWKLISYNFYYESKWEKLDVTKIKDYFISRKKDGYYISKEQKDKILETWKKFKTEMIDIIKSIKNSLKSK